MNPGRTGVGLDGLSLRAAARATPAKIEQKILFSGRIVV
jgi:hypothetical protein